MKINVNKEQCVMRFCVDKTRNQTNAERELLMETSWSRKAGWGPRGGNSGFRSTSRHVGCRQAAATVWV